jgi:integrase
MTLISVNSPGCVSTSIEPPGLPHCSAHGLRKAAATRLADAGCSASQIAAITGHKTLVEVSHYTRAADQRRLAQQALAIQLGATDKVITKLERETA